MNAADSSTNIKMKTAPNTSAMMTLGQYRRRLRFTMFAKFTKFTKFATLIIFTKFTRSTLSDLDSAFVTFGMSKLPTMHMLKVSLKLTADLTHCRLPRLPTELIYHIALFSKPLISVLMGTRAFVRHIQHSSTKLKYIRAYDDDAALTCDGLVWMPHHLVYHYYNIVRIHDGTAALRYST